MRSMGNNKKTITATPRQLESLIRISESIAKMRLSDRVEKTDIEEAVRLIKTAMQQAATDPKTGEIDMDIIATGVSATSTKRVKEISDVIKKITVSKINSSDSLTRRTSGTTCPSMGSSTSTCTSSSIKRSKTANTPSQKNSWSMSTEKPSTASKKMATST